MRQRAKAFAFKTFLVAMAIGALPITAASGQGLFEFLFGGYRPPPPPLPAPMIRSYAPPSYPERYHDRSSDGDDGRRVGGDRARESGRSGGSRVAYCVRHCDGRYFPLREHNGTSASEMCNAQCPAASTSLFYGRAIDDARDRQGRAYADLENAFVYRERVVNSCTCNGKSSFGLAHIAVTDDPTLRKGDIVATGSGLMVYNGEAKDSQASYTPIDRAKVAKSVREQLAGVEVKGGAPWYEAIAIPLPIARPEYTSSIGNERRVSARLR